MKPPGVARGRRAFLAPIWLAAIAVVLVAAVLLAGVRLAMMGFAEVTTIVIVRHAEKQATPGTDPPLSAEGVDRAGRLAQMFGNSGGVHGRNAASKAGATGIDEVGTVQAIYVTDTQRSRQTAAPLAAQLGLQPIELPSEDVDRLLAQLSEQGEGRISLVVGHANTVPRLIDGLTDGRTRVELDPADFGSVFIVTVSRFDPPSVLRLRY